MILRRCLALLGLLPGVPCCCYEYMSSRPQSMYDLGHGFFVVFAAKLAWPDFIVIGEETLTTSSLPTGLVASKSALMFMNFVLVRSCDFIFWS